MDNLGNTEATLEQGVKGEIICIPVKLSAFVLNYKVVDRRDENVGNYCIGPLLQPDYNGLSTDPQYLSKDINPRTEEGLYRHCYVEENPRISDPITGQIRQNRQGVYLHWTLPQLFRSTAEPTESSTGFHENVAARGYRLLGSPSDAPKQPSQKPNAQVGDAAQNANKEPHSRVYRAIPNRWLVFRWIDLKSIQAPDNQDDVREFEVFLIESDRCRSLSDLGDDVDIEIDVSPFIDAQKAPSEQADCFIGMRHESGSDSDSSLEAKNVPLSVFTSSNPLFADFQPHNGNVLSIVDTFSYTKTLPGDKRERSFLTAVTASYVVMGWVDNKDNDVMSNSTSKHGRHLKDLGMMLASDSSSPAVQKWLQSSGSGRSLCHGALYNVKWNVDQAPTIIPVEDFAKIVADDSPISVGSTPLESLRASLKRMESDVTKTTSHLYNLEHFQPGEHEPISEEYRKRDDMLESAFRQSVRSSTWNFSKENPISKHGDLPDKRSPLGYTPKQIELMVKLRSGQAIRDACYMECLNLQWKLFAEWWKFMSDARRCSPKSAQELNESLLGRVRDELAYDKIAQCLDFLSQKKKAIANLAGALGEATKGPTQPFYRRKDPTITVSGTASPWDLDFADTQKVRLGSQVVSALDNVQTPDTNENLNTVLADAINMILKKVDGNMTMLIMNLTREWYLLRYDKGGGRKDLNIQVMPLFHDKTPADDGTGGRDFWNNTQPFFPLFVEWEAAYFHLDFNTWTAYSDDNRLAYDLNRFVGKGYDKNISRLSGRDLILPQVASEMIQKFSMDGRGNLSQHLKNKLMNLPHLSFSLRGLTEQLTTRFAHGSHLTPLSSLPGREPTVVEEAVALPTFNERVISLMGAQLDPLPYASFVDTVVRTDSPSDGAQKETVPSPFRPATHGQVCITKIRIIDRFGQVVGIPDFMPYGPQRFKRLIYPAVADRYCCKPLADPHGNLTPIANAVVLDHEGKCAFFQLPPSINQNARLNAHFVVPTDTGRTEGAAGRTYRPFYEQWESPIWGWLIVNYAEFGIQFFLPSGKFIGEVRLGGRKGTRAPVHWLPFEEPVTVRELASPDDDVTELEALMSTFKDPDYLVSFMQMIGDSLPHSEHAPATYAEQMSSMVGRPLALVNFGVSLQLEEPPRENESTANSKPPERLLMDYQFRYKIGELDRLTDGLVGYFQSASTISEGGSVEAGMPDINVCFTNFSREENSNTKNKCRITPISDDSLQVLKPYYVNFLNLLGQIRPQSPTEMSQDQHDKLSEMYATEHAKHLRIYSAIMDPYLPIHIDTGGLLPVKKLQLPAWTVKSALERLTFFFQVGPITVVDDPLNPRQKPTTTGGDAKKDNPSEQKTKVQLPVLGIGTWEWLQPVVEKQNGNPLKTNGDHLAEKNRKFEKFETAPVDLGVAAMMAPQTVVEGYLHMIEPLTSTPNPKKTK